MYDLFKTNAQRDYKGPSELAPVADFLPHIGEYVLMFSRLERHVTWAIESFLGINQLDGNELEGMVQNFSSRIKFLDVCARPKTTTENQIAERKSIIKLIKTTNAFRNRLLHSHNTGISYIDSGLRMNFKQMTKDSGKTRHIEISLDNLKGEVNKIPVTISTLRVWVHGYCPDAERRVP